jgi:mono/diheme cytochrome c family protein/cytochrome c553
MRRVFPDIFRLAMIPGFVALSMGGCAFQYEKAGSPPSPSGGVSPSFAQVRDQVLIPKCASCHEHQNEFSDYAGTYAERDLIRQRVFVDHTMPRNGALDADQLSALERWLDAGAPEQAQLPTEPVTPPALPPVIKPSPTPDPVAAAIASISQSFDSKIRPLVDRSCTACHDANAKPEGLLGDLPGVRELEWKHIREASKVLDFTRSFPSWSSQSSDPVFFLEQIRAAIQKKSMPPSEFNLFHHLDGRLLKASEKLTLINWTIESELLLARADSAVPTALKIFQNRCMGCHNTSTNAGGLAFAAAGDQLVIPAGTAKDSSIPYYTQGSPENSAAYLVLLPDAASRKGLPQMPLNTDPLSAQELEIVNAWFLKGKAASGDVQ